MRKITHDAIMAFNNGYEFTRDNTRVFCDGNTVVMSLHGNEIAKRENGKLFIRTCGWATTTTKERLNGLSGVSTYTSRHTLCLNGSEWVNHDEWTEID
jgi:hypothetical protein